MEREVKYIKTAYIAVVVFLTTVMLLGAFVLPHDFYV